MLIIEKHKIYQDFIEILVPITKKLSAAKNKKNTYPLAGVEDFIFNLFQFLIEIENKLKDLNLSAVFISTFPSYKPWRKCMSREEYITYHLEYYNINIIALFDRLLHLVNFLYDLGLADKYVTLSCITSNKHIGEFLSRKLKKLDKELEPIRFLQNKIKHKNKLKIRDLYLASLMEFSLRSKGVGEKYSKEDQKNLKADMDYYYREWITKEKKKMIDQNDRISNHIEDMLNYLFNQYQERRNNLSKVLI